MSSCSTLVLNLKESFQYGGVCCLDFDTFEHFFNKKMFDEKNNQDI